MWSYKHLFESFVKRSNFAIYLDCRLRVNDNKVFNINIL